MYRLVKKVKCIAGSGSALKRYRTLNNLYSGWSHLAGICILEMNQNVKQWSIFIYTNMIKSKSRKHLGNLSYWNESKYCNSEVSKQALAKKQESMPLHRKYINKANDKIWFMFVCFFKLRGCNIRNVSAALTALMKVFPWFPCTFQKFYTLTLFWQMQILNIIPILSRLFSIYNNHLIVHNTKKAIHFILHKRIRRLKRNQTIRLYQLSPLKSTPLVSL